MSFEYRDDTGARLTVATSSTGISIWTQPEDVVVPQSRVEEVVSGIRDAARQAPASAAKPVTVPLNTPCATCQHPYNWHTPGRRCQVTSARLRCNCQAFVTPAARQTTGQADTAQRVAELEAEIARLHDKHTASLRHADQVNNELMEEVGRYVEAGERPVLWSVYNEMHGRALAAEAKLAAVPAAEQPDPTTNDDPTPLRWGLGDVLHGDDDTVIVCLSGPAPDHAPYWLELDAERAAVLRKDLAAPGDVPVAEQQETCRPVDVDGTPVLVRGTGDWTADDQRHMAVIVAAAKRKYEAEQPAVGQPAEAQATNPRQPAYDAVYAYIRSLGNHLPPYPVERNAMIWRAVNAALDAMSVGRCVSSHCVEGDHVIDLGPADSSPGAES
ncbi:hypothetical protein ACFVZH_22570 [Streptomyces sp. NPDC059534]|uniref:hypothetical protein n=1 Tax=Streptomyces sp. NPDC059534 TaxID=3346859 RepID=UPI00369A23A1